jgi:hypothetical protein
MPKSHRPLRDWGSSSYDRYTGRSASSLAADGKSSNGYVNACGNASSQLDEAAGRAEGGAPNAHGMNRSGSGDKGRVKQNRYL